MESMSDVEKEGSVCDFSQTRRPKPARGSPPPPPTRRSASNQKRARRPSRPPPGAPSSTTAIFSSPVSFLPSHVGAGGSSRALFPSSSSGFPLASIENDVTPYAVPTAPTAAYVEYEDEKAWNGSASSALSRMRQRRKEKETRKDGPSPPDPGFTYALPVASMRSVASSSSFPFRGRDDEDEEYGGCPTPPSFGGLPRTTALGGGGGLVGHGGNGEERLAYGAGYGKGAPLFRESWSTAGPAARWRMNGRMVEAGGGGGPVMEPPVPTTIRKVNALHQRSTSSGTLLTNGNGERGGGGSTGVGGGGSGTGSGTMHMLSHSTLSSSSASASTSSVPLVPGATASSTSTTAGAGGVASPINAIPTHFGPRANPQTAMNGFIAMILVGVAFVLYMIWLLVPQEMLHRLHLSYYPNKYWAFAIPAMLTMLGAFYFYISCCLVLFTTHPLEDARCVTDVDTRKDTELNCGALTQTTGSVAPWADIPVSVASTLLFQPWVE